MITVSTRVCADGAIDLTLESRFFETINITLDRDDAVMIRYALDRALAEEVRR